MAKKQTHTSSENKTRVAVYARFSCDKQRDESIEDQLYEAERYCESHGYQIVRVYPDYAISGRSDDRPQFLQMIEDAQTGAFEIVLVWKMDRFARNMQDQFFHEKILNDCGVRLESIKENISGNGIEASLSKGMHAIFAQVRSQQSAEDTMRGMLGKARKCQYLGYSLFGYSHDGDTITLDPVNAPIAEEIHTRYLNGEAIKTIVSSLNARGVRTTRGTDITNSFITGILKNWRYAGVYMWGFKRDEQGNKIIGADGRAIPLVRVEEGMPAIVSRYTKERCIERLYYRKHVNAKANYLLSGKMYCAECGHPMRGETCKNGNGVDYWRYTCQKKRKACLGVFWKDETEGAVARSVRSMLEDEKLLERIAEVFAEYRSNKKPRQSIAAAKNDLKALRKQRDNLIKAVEDGMPYKHVKTKLESIDARQEGIEYKIAEMERAENEISKAEVLALLSEVAQGTRTTADIINAFVHQIWLYRHHAIAIMNFTGMNATTRYEIDCVMNAYEQTGATCSYETALAPQTSSNTNIPPTLYTADGVPVILFESGFGVVVTLKAA